MALPKKVLVDLELLLLIFEYLNKLGDDEGFKLADQILVKLDAISRREAYAQNLRRKREEALDEWLKATETEKDL